MNIKNEYQKIKNIKLAELLFYAFPISFIIGNLILSLNLLLFIIAGFVLIKKEQLTFRFNASYWLLITFFLYFFLSTAIQFQSPGILNEKIQDLPLENNPIFKSIILLRFLFLIIIVDTLFFNNILNLKKFFFISFICTSFVSFDIIFQYLMGFDLFGLKSVNETRNSGPFGDEIIAGSYLQRFSLFSIFYIFVIFEKKNFNNLLLFFIITIHLTAILLAGNKMPMLLFFLGCFLIFLILKNMRWVLVSSLAFFLIIFAVIYKYNNNYRDVYSGFFNEINFIKIINKINIQKKQIQKFESKKDYYEKVQSKIIPLKGSGHIGLFSSSYKMWKDQPIFGFGLKSFRIKCWEFSPPRTEEYIRDGALAIGCSTHPHNYYLELLSEAGIIGIGLIIIFFLILLKDSYCYLKKYIKTQNSEMVLLIPVIILFILEIWPIKSTGSFFTTWNATFLWLNVAILFSIKFKKSS